MNALLAHSWFLHFGVPLITVLLGIYLKFVTRSDFHTPFKWEDLAVGPEISITALIIFITGSVSIANEAVTTADPAIKTLLEQKLMSMPWLLLAFVLGIWGMSTLVRKIGWKSESELRVFWGIIVPDVFGIGTLLLVVNWIG